VAYLKGEAAAFIKAQTQDLNSRSRGSRWINSSRMELLGPDPCRAFTQSRGRTKAPRVEAEQEICYISAGMVSRSKASMRVSEV
jgi:hypothetical protein